MVDTVSLESGASFPKGSKHKTFQAAWTSEYSYILVLLLMLSLYLFLGCLSLVPNGTIGKLSPFHETVASNYFLQELLRAALVGKASVFQLQASFYATLFFLSLTYGWSLYIVSRRPEKGLFSILAFALPVMALMVIIPPLVSKDVFSNIFYARIAAWHHENPYLLSPQKFVDDPLMSYLSLHWKNTAIVYGPVHTHLSILLTRLAGRGITANIYVFKGSLALFHLINTLILWKILDFTSPWRKRMGVAAYAWNPIALAIGIGGGHNDLMMVTFVLLSVYFLLRGNKWPAYVFLCLSILVKYITLILLPPFICCAVAQKRGLWPKLRETALLLAALAAISFTAFIPFWRGLETFRSTLNNIRISNMGSVGGILALGLEYLLHHGLRLPQALAATVGTWVPRLALIGIFFFVWIRTTVGVREWDALPEAFSVIIFVYLLTTGYYMPWYFLWLLPFLAMKPHRRGHLAALAGGTATIILGCDVHPY